MRNYFAFNLHHAVLWAFVLALTGCATEPDAQPSLDASAALVRQHIADVHPGKDATGEVPNLEGQSITMDQSVAMAIARHPSIIADLARIKEADAQLVQAGLLPNPSLYGSLGFASDGGIGFAMASLTQSLSALWQRPDRQAVANAQLQQMIVRVAFNTLEVAGNAQRIHRTVVYRQEMIVLLDQKAGLIARMVQSAKDRFDIGTGDALEVQAITVQAHRVALDRQQALADLADAKRRLLEVMGMASASSGFTAVSSPMQEVAVRNEAHAVELGLAQRLDIQAAKWALAITNNDLALAKTKVIPEVSVGVEYEKEDSMNTVGPAGAVELPIFDQGQARVAAAKAANEREEALYQSVVQQATLQVRQAWIAFDSKQRQAEFQHAKVVPRAEITLKFKQSSFETGDASSLEILRAQAELLDAQMAGLQASYEADLAGIALWQATGWGVDTFGVMLSQKESRSQIIQK